MIGQIRARKYILYAIEFKKFAVALIALGPRILCVTNSGDRPHLKA